MKLIEAIIQPYHLTPVLSALERVAVERLTVLDAHSYGEQVFPAAPEPGSDEPSPVYRNVVLEIIVNDDFVDRTLEAIVGAARTGRVGRDGDGKILVVPVIEAIRIDELVRGPGAV